MFQKYISFLFILFVTFSGFSQKAGIPDAPNPPRLYNNLSRQFPNFVSRDEAEKLEQKLALFANQTSNQIAIVIIDDLAGYEPWDFATELGEAWKIGQEGADNGIVILIKPTSPRAYYIAIGRGLEGAIPDVTSRRIAENELVPNLKSGDYSAALEQTTDVLMSIAKGEYNSDQYGAKHKAKSGGIAKGIFIVLFIMFIIFVFVRKNGGGRGGRGFTMGSGGIFFGGGGFGGGSSGGFGGGSSGGFGGFGGGSFGGGGSGGSW